MSETSELSWTDQLSVSVSRTNDWTTESLHLQGDSLPSVNPKSLEAVGSCRILDTHALRGCGQLSPEWSRVARAASDGKLSWHPKKRSMLKRDPEDDDFGNRPRDGPCGTWTGSEASMPREIIDRDHAGALCLVNMFVGRESS